MSIAIMSYRPSNFMETDDMFLQFEDDLDNNIAGGSSSVGDNTGESKNFLHFNLQIFHVLFSNFICYCLFIEQSLLLNKRLRLLGDVRSLDSWS